VTFRLVISRRAANEIAANYDWLAERSTPSANRWRDSILRAVELLEANPDRCPLAHEDEWYEGELRELLHGKRKHVFRILFEVCGEEVVILRVRHASQDYLSAGEL
jgi:plasmid stabilization system protein ParE